VQRTTIWEKPFFPTVVMSYPLVFKKYFKDPQSYSRNPRAVSLEIFHHSLVTASIMASSLADVRSISCRPAFKTLVDVTVHVYADATTVTETHQRLDDTDQENVTRSPYIIAAQILQPQRFNDLSQLFVVCVFQDRWTTTISCRILRSVKNCA